MHKRGLLAAAITVTTVIAAAAAAEGSATAAPSTTPIPNSKPAWTAHATKIGQVERGQSVTARVYLAPKGGIGALRAEALAVSTPGNASYRHFLSKTQYQARFGTTDAVAHQVRSYLTSHGLHVTGVGAQNSYLSVQGSASDVEQAFSTKLVRFRHAGQNVQAPADALQAPTSVARSILSISGLDTTSVTRRPSSATTAPPSPGFRSARPCSTYFGQLKAKYQADFKTPLPVFQGQQLSYAPCGYTGPQLRSAYEGNTTLTGKGVTVGIVDAYASPTIAKDASQYAAAHGDSAYATGQLTQSKLGPFTQGGPKQCDASGWYGEETLDVEAVHAMAPGADIHYYGAKNCNQGLYDALAQVVEDDDVSLVSNSWGDVGEEETTGTVAAVEKTLLQGATEGISFLFSSGDDGDELAATGLKSADYPASDPYVTGVGGTSTAIVPAKTGYTIGFEAGWGTDKYTLSKDGKSWTPAGFLYGSGGGQSTLFNQPSYQASLTHSATRQVPDVAMDADPNTGMLVGQTQTFPDGTYYDEYRIGGTSLASPLFAGMTALAEQSSGGRAGLLNPAIYQDASSDFTDVAGAPQQAGDVRVDYVNTVNASDGLVYSVRTFGDDSSLKVTKGYDEVTGVGVPNTKWLTALPKAGKS